MRFLTLLALGATLTSSVTARRSTKHTGRTLPELPRVRSANGAMRPGPELKARQAEPLVPQNENTTKYAVDGTGLPEVDFDIGESYAGLMPIAQKSGEYGNASDSELYFWYFPSANPNATDEIMIWLNGGPGCSSLEGFFQENGPVIWQYGTYKPTKNYWTWVNLTNMVWVEQPVGTGFSQGTPTATNEKEVAAQFMGFWKNFIDTFDLHNRKVYITGESYAGYYVPNIASAMLDTNDTTYFDVHGTIAYDPVVSYDVIGNDVPTLPMVDHYKQLFNLNETFLTETREKADACGYTDFFNTYLTFPPVGPFPSPPQGGTPGPNCTVWEDVFNAVLLTNPCFDVYQIATTCPVLWDVLGFPGSFEYLPEGTQVYFNRTDVQRAINAPIQEWSECSNGVLDTDTSPPSFFDVYPGVIERSKRTLIVHGDLDFILLANGTLLAIQNMTWGGAQGFQEAPSETFYVPYHSEASTETLSGAGVLGKTREERGLAWVQLYLAGHMVPQYSPAAAYRQVEWVLGRIASLEEVSNFSTQPEGEFGNEKR